MTEADRTASTGALTPRYFGLAECHTAHISRVTMMTLNNSSLWDLHVNLSITVRRGHSLKPPSTPAPAH
jgi:hypothetical protein